MAILRCANGSGPRRELAPRFLMRRCHKQIRLGTKSSIPLRNKAVARHPRAHGQTAKKSRYTTALDRKVGSSADESQTKGKNFPFLSAHSGMTETKSERSELTSLNQLVHEIIGGAVRRHTFTQWELELLLDLQTCRIRKSSRPEVLRRYLKAVQQHFADGALDPLRLSTFLEQENQRSRVVINTEALAAR